MNLKSLRIISATFLLVATTFSSSILAADISIKGGDNSGNATFHEILTAGQKIDKYVELVNSSENTANGTLQARDGIQTADGAYTSIGVNEENKNAGTWYTTPETNITLTGGQIKRVDFSVTVPQSTKPGEYGSALSMVEKGDASTSGNIQLVNVSNIRNLFAVKGTSREDLKLGSKINDLKFVTSPETGRVSALNLEVINVGNLFDQLDITANITGPKNYSTIKQVKTNIAPGDSTVALNSTLAVGEFQNGNYRLTLNLKNSPYNRRITDSDYVNVVKEQKMVYTFTIAEGKVRDAKIEENNLSKDGFDAGWWKPEYLWFVLAGLIIISLLTWWLLNNKNKKTKIKSSYDTIKKPTTKINL
jgi:hypothetical protein